VSPQTSCIASIPPKNIEEKLLYFNIDRSESAIAMTEGDLAARLAEVGLGDQAIKDIVKNRKLSTALKRCPR